MSSIKRNLIPARIRTPFQRSLVGGAPGPSAAPCGGARTMTFV